MTGAESTSLPLDPDIEVDLPRVGRPRPLHLRWSSLAVVFAGGTVGAGAREALSLAFPAGGGIPWAILAINVTGAFLLGFLLDALARRGADEGRRRTLRLLLGTGVMGGYTTYSTLATDVAGLIGRGDAGAGIGYGIGSVVLGAVATFAGIVLAGILHRARSEAAS